MNREIKFRAWLKDTKEMIEVEDIQFYRKDTIEIDGITFKPKSKEEQELIINTNSAWRSENEIELMQYTGLKDKNGKEIYEGDVVRIKNHSLEEYKENFITEIKFINGAFRYMYKDGSGSVLDGYRINLKGDEYKKYGGIKIEIIGNIYENPDLIDN